MIETILTFAAAMLVSIVGVSMYDATAVFSKEENQDSWFKNYGQQLIINFFVSLPIIITTVIVFTAVEILIGL